MNILQLFKINLNNIYNKYINNAGEDNREIYYIGGSQTLPPPLSQKEEEELLEKLENNNEEAKKTLVERNLRLVVYISKYKISNICIKMCRKRNSNVFKENKQNKR